MNADNSGADNTNKHGQFQDLEEKILQYVREREKALSIPLIHNKILSFLSLSDLKNIRQVNKTWNSIASAQISRSRCKKIRPLRFQFANNKNNLEENNTNSEYILHTRDFESFDKIDKIESSPLPLSKLKTLRDFITILEKSTNLSVPFFWTHFTFIRGDLFNGGAARFFQLYGERIKTLVICDVDAFKFKVAQNWRLFLKQIPNVEKLMLDSKCGLYYYSEENSILNADLVSQMQTQSEEEFHLKQLKTFLLGDGEMNELNSIKIVELMERAPNLKYIGLSFKHNSNSNSLESRLSQIPTARLNLIKELHLKMAKGGQKLRPETLSKLVDAKISLFILSFSQSDSQLDIGNDNEIEIRALLSKILRSSQNSLQCLNWFYKIDPIPEIQFPHVQDLTLFLDRRNSPFEAIKTTARFPHVKRLQFDFLVSCYSDIPVQGLWSDFFHVPVPGSGFQWESIEELKLKRECPSPWWPRLANLFPNLKVLECEFYSHAKTVKRYFELWGKLKLVRVIECSGSVTEFRISPGSESESESGFMSIKKKMFQKQQKQQDDFIFGPLLDEPQLFTMCS